MTRTLFLPLAVGADGRFLTIERGSDQDRAQRIRAVAGTRPGERWDALAMGVEHLEFAERPVDQTQLAATLAQHTDIPVTIIQTTPLLDQEIRDAAADLELRYPTEEAPRG